MSAARVSSFCSVGGCVHVRYDGDRVHVTASPDAAESLSFDLDEWAAFLAGVRNGEFDVAAPAGNESRNEF